MMRHAHVPVFRRAISFPSPLLQLRSKSSIVSVGHVNEYKRFDSAALRPSFVMPTIHNGNANTVVVREKSAFEDGGDDIGAQVAQMFKHVRERPSVNSENVSLDALAEQFRVSTVEGYVSRCEQTGMNFAADGKPSPAEYLDWLELHVLNNEMNLNAPNMIGHMVNTLPSYSPHVAALLTSLNLNVVKTETAKSITFLEREAVAMLHRLVYEQGDEFYAAQIQNRSSCMGVVCCGGTTANIQALWMARNRAFPNMQEEGFFQSDSSCTGAVVFASELCHYSIDKGCAALGIGKNNLIKIPTDSKLTVRLDVMRERAYEAVKQGKKIVALVGVAGSTEAGSFDDLQGMAELAKELDCHFHIDAAWGGGALLSDRLRSSLCTGVELADSVTIDGHKQLYTPMGCGVVLFRNPEAAELVRTSAKYIIRADSFDQGRFTLEGSRPPMAVHLHMNLVCVGEQIGSIIEGNCQLAERFGDMIKNSKDFELITEFGEGARFSNIVLYRYVGSRNKPRLLGSRGTDGTTDSLAADNEEISELNDELSSLCAQIQTAQSEKGHTFTSRTTVSLSAYNGQKVTVFRAVLGRAGIDDKNLVNALEDQRKIARSFKKQMTNEELHRDVMMFVPHIGTDEKGEQFWCTEPAELLSVGA